MVLGGLAKLQVLWKEWNLRGFIIASFIIQVVLILVSPFRKHTSNAFVIFSIWLSYLLAEWIAVQAVGFISKTTHKDAEDSLFAFWAQFLLVHLGGPDSITALALEDNELWIRTALQLAAQVYATFGVLVKFTLQTNLLAPTILMFFTGAIKYFERVLSLLKGRLTNFEEVTENYEYELRAYMPRWDHDSELTDVDMVKDAFYFFNHYKGLYADQIFRSHELQNSRTYFLCRKPEEAFKVLEIELNFVYGAFYTKMVIVHKSFGMVLRLIAMSFELACFLIWYFTSKHAFHHYDIGITYTLLIGAIVLDVFALFRILLSDWTIARLKGSSRIIRLCNVLLSARNRTWGTYWRKEDAPISTRLRRTLFSRWSESVLQFNLINFCEDSRSKRMQKVIEFFCLKDVLDGCRYVTKRWFSNDLRDIIFAELRKKSKKANEPIPFQMVIGAEDWASTYERCLISRDYAKLLEFRGDDERMFDQSLLAWHVATEIMYQSETGVAGEEKKKENCLKRIFCRLKSVFLSIWALFNGKTVNKDKQKASDEEIHREFCKVVSDYMLYLLIRKPTMVPIYAGMSKLRFRDICKHINWIIEDEAVRYNKTCQYMLDKRKAISDYWIERDPVLKEARDIAGKLLELKGENKEIWSLTAGMWTSFLCYAAKHCKASVHAAQLKQGGELLSLVWLLMVHFGLKQTDI